MSGYETRDHGHDHARRQLEAIVADRKRAQKYVARAKVILATADGFGTNEVTPTVELIAPYDGRKSFTG